MHFSEKFGGGDLVTVATGAFFFGLALLVVCGGLWKRWNVRSKK
jgi:hypothetical protein